MNIGTSQASTTKIFGWYRVKEVDKLDKERRLKLQRREKELMARIERMKQTMNETKEMDTLALQMRKLKEAKEELRRIQEKLSGTATRDDSEEAS